MIECKYKIGDKIMCIKEFVIDWGDGITQTGKVGYTTEIIFINNLEKDKTPIWGTDYVFSVDEINNNFISPAEWREQQINEVLND